MYRTDHDWIRAYLALLAHVGELRGLVESPETDIQRWPLTTGADVVLIAALVDPYVRACGDVASSRRWRAAISPAMHVATSAPRAAYADNRGFWQLLASSCVDMHAASVPLPPPEMWRGLFHELRCAAHRNAADSPPPNVPFIPRDTALALAKQSPGELYRAQLAAVMNQRGFDLMDAPPEHSFGGTGMKIPRATNADALAMSEFWSGWLALVPRTIQGTDAVAAKWGQVKQDVERLAAGGKPDEVYAKNNDLWRELPNVAGKVTEWANQPDGWQMYGDAFIDRLKRLPETIHDVGKAIAGGTEKAAGALAHGVGKMVNEGAKGAFSGFGLPLAIGAGAIGLFFLLRGRKREDAPTQEAS